MTLENRNDEREARIAAYAFGELEGEEFAAMEVEIAADPALAERVAELRAFGDEMSMALLDEPVPPAAESVRAPGGFANAEWREAEFPASRAGSRGRVARFPAWAWAATGLAAAAGVAVVAWLRSAGGGDGPTLPDLRTQEVVAVETLTLPAPPEAEAPRVAVSPPVEAVVVEPPVLAKEEKEAAPEAVVEVVRDVRAEVVPSLMVAAVEPVIEMPTNTLPSPVADPAARVRAMLDTGRSRYAAGDLDAAASAFDAVMKAQSGNREARYFSARIAQERLRAGPGRPQVVSGARPAKRSDASATRGVAGATRPPTAMFTTRRDPDAALVESGFVPAWSDPVSSFSVDVDTASYTIVRRALRTTTRMAGVQRDALRIEELINFFPYDYAPPAAQTDGVTPVFAAHLAVAAAPWAPERRLVRVALKGAELGSEGRPPANLVFVIDISDSMEGRQSLPLVRESLLQLVGLLRPDDHVAIVNFSGKARLALPSTSMKEDEKIRTAIKELDTRGTTNAEAGIKLGYEVAQEHFRPEEVNRVILCTDGIFASKTSDHRPVHELVRERALGRVYLTVLGFGEHTPRGDRNLETMADKGDGVYHFVDSLAEARRILVEDIDGTLATIAKDVKVRVEFNPARVASYRLIGYDNRALGGGQFDEAEVDAGEVGVGHAVTALYEIEPTGERIRKRSAGASSEVAEEDRLLTVTIRYKDPFEAEAETREQAFALADSEVDFKDADKDFRFAASVAAWGMLLRESPYKGNVDLDDVRRWAKDALGDDPGGHREEFLVLVKNSRPASAPRF